jgi:hypothetical protein
VSPAPVRRVAGVAAVSVLAAIGIGGCANSNALGLIRQACTHVQRSLVLYGASTAATSPAAAQSESTAALEQLRDAMPLAATAAGENAQWDAFSVTLSESSRVPESDLVRALHAQCADVSSGGGQPTTSTTSTTSAPVPTNPAPVGR